MTLPLSETNKPSVITDNNILVHLERITEDTPVIKRFDPMMRGVIVLHPSTKRFYTTGSSNPQRYFKTLFYKPAAYKGVSLGLKRLLDKDPHFEFYYCHSLSRDHVAVLLHKQGWTRVATGIGQAQESPSHFFVVKCPTWGMYWALTAPAQTKPETIVKKANKAIESWLYSLSNDRRNVDIRVRLRDGLGKRLDPSRVIFNTDAIVYDRGAMTIPAKDYSKFTKQANQAIIARYLNGGTGRSKHEPIELREFGITL